ncbi:hypothetical protein A8H26_15795 [Pluralibacter gergoviae]|nr:hypothetical protein A8H26_15795 [Pluralibacter gergoviae]
MAKNSVEAYGASGKSNVLFFEPDALHLVDDRQKRGPDCRSGKARSMAPGTDRAWIPRRDAEDSHRRWPDRSAAHHVHAEAGKVNFGNQFIAGGVLIIPPAKR